jgi:hypothetical protein
LHKILGALPVAVTQAQGMDEQRVAVFGVQRADELLVIGHAGVLAPGLSLPNLLSFTRPVRARFS